MRGGVAGICHPGFFGIWVVGCFVIPARPGPAIPNCTHGVCVVVGIAKNG